MIGEPKPSQFHLRVPPAAVHGARHPPTSPGSRIAADLDREVLLHAQASAVGFYLRRGFRPVGDAFEEAGIPHQAMAITL